MIGQKKTHDSFELTSYASLDLNKEADRKKKKKNKKKKRKTPVVSWSLFTLCVFSFFVVVFVIELISKQKRMLLKKADYK